MPCHTFKRRNYWKYTFSQLQSTTQISFKWKWCAEICWNNFPRQLQGPKTNSFHSKSMSRLERILILFSGSRSLYSVPTNWTPYMKPYLHVTSAAREGRTGQKATARQMGSTKVHRSANPRKDTQKSTVAGVSDNGCNVVIQVTPTCYMI